jgi:hypothetical protein
MKKLAAVFLSLFFFVTCSRQVADTTDETVTGIKARIQYEDGTPVNGATVKVFEVSDSTCTPASVSVTDANGKYTIDSLPKGTYNIWAQKDTLVSFQDSVYISTNSTIGEGTVQPEGSITGIVAMQPNDDPRSAYVQILGSERFSNNVSADGFFTLNGLATGNYNLRISTTKVNYTPTFFQIGARSGFRDTLKDTLWIIYTGIPVATGLKATYDTLNGLVRLSWNKPAFRDFQDFVIYKDLFTSTERTKLPIAILDTFFEDTVFKNSMASGQYSFSDTNDYHYKYRVAVRNNSDKEGDTYKFVDVVAASPTKVQTTFSFTIYHLANEFMTDTASINDTLRYTVNIYNPTRSLRKITWTDLTKSSIIRSKNLDTTSRHSMDTVKYLWSTIGEKELECTVNDMAGTTWKDTVFVLIVKDNPTVSISTTPQVVARNDTIEIHADASDKFGRIIKYEWDLGNTGTFTPGNSDTFYVAPNEFTNRSFSVRVTNDDGNSVIETIVKQIAFKIQESSYSAAFPPRSGHTSVVFNGKMWVIGGCNGQKFMNDVWYSTDGATWNRATDSSAFSPRAEHTSVVFSGKMWIIGGASSQKLLNDVWYSTDGATWNRATDSSAFSPRAEHTSVVFNDKMWVIGSKIDFNNPNKGDDVWYTNDGITWTQATDSAAFCARSNHTSVVFDNKMWVFGGRRNYTSGVTTNNELWYSTDGISWSKSVFNEDFGYRLGHTCVVSENKMWIVGGNTPTFSNLFINDVWFTSDGITWSQAVDSALFPPRAEHTSVVFDNKMWVIGGYDDNGSKNDVWWLK